MSVNLRSQLSEELGLTVREVFHLTLFRCLHHFAFNVAPTLPDHEELSLCLKGKEKGYLLHANGDALDADAGGALDEDEEAGGTLDEDDDDPCDRMARLRSFFPFLLCIEKNDEISQMRSHSGL